MSAHALHIWRLSLLSSLATFVGKRTEHCFTLFLDWYWLWKRLKGKENYFSYSSTKADFNLSRQLVACSRSIHRFYLQNAFHHRYLFSLSFKLEKLFDVTSFGSKSCFTIEISFESVASYYKLVARSLCWCERSFDRHKLNVTVY